MRDVRISTETRSDGVYYTVYRMNGSITLADGMLIITMDRGEAVKVALLYLDGRS